MLMPPTWLTLSELAGFATADDVRNAPREIVRIAPTLIREDDHVRVVLEPR